MFLRLNSIIENTKVEGPGNRTAIFVQGCIKHCKGCNSPQTWDLDDGYLIDIKKLSNKILKNKTIEGVTFSGGEPFLQSKALYQLAVILKQNDLSIVTFTGYSYDIIRKVNSLEWNNLLSVTDILISGSFNQDKITYQKPWVGSSNQEYTFLTDKYAYLEDNMDLIENKIEIRLNKDGSFIVNGMGDNKKIRELFENNIKK